MAHSREMFGKAEIHGKKGKQCTKVPHIYILKAMPCLACLKIESIALGKCLIQWNIWPGSNAR